MIRADTEGNGIAKGPVFVRGAPAVKLHFQRLSKGIASSASRVPWEPEWKAVSIPGASPRGQAQKLPRRERRRPDPTLGRRKPPRAWGRLNRKVGTLWDAGCQEESGDDSANCNSCWGW